MPLLTVARGCSHLMASGARVSTACVAFPLLLLIPCPPFKLAGWDVLNEPRCPGCLTYEQQAIAVSWMHDMASLTKRLAPNQLAALGTEDEVLVIG
eukprot:1159258-Pelagomonas_calceolata.AAC.5